LVLFALQARYVLKNLMRDWSAEGAEERAQSYGLIVAELRERFADWCGS
jgi:carnosine N-methyltransferase